MLEGSLSSPYTNAKQLIPVANKSILFYILEKIADEGIQEVGIIVGDTMEEIKSAVGNGERWNIRVTYIYQPLPLGLAHAVKTASEFLGEEDFIMILGDNLFSMSLSALIENFRKNLSNAAILLHPVKDPSRFGVAVVENGEIKKLVEKPKEWISNLIITGVYIFDKHIFKAIEQTAPSARGELEITDAIQKFLESGGKVSYELTEGWWKDTGTLHDILEANRLMLDRMTGNTENLSNSDCVFTGKIQLGKNTTIKNSVLNGPVIIGDHCLISDSTIGPFASIGNHVTIEHCTVENSIILEATQIGNVGKTVCDSLIGKNVVIKGDDKEPSSNRLLVGDHCQIYL